MKAPLEYLVRPAKENAGLVVLLHGVGSNEEDLFSLEDAFRPEDLVLSVRAPLVFGPRSYGWFPVQFTPEGPVIDAVEAEKSRVRLLEFLSWARQFYQVEAGRVRLVGFSQGGILASSVALTEPDQVNSAALMSSRILPEVLSQAAATDRVAATSYLIAHGTQDQVLPVHHARESRRVLQSFGLEPEYREFPMAHTVTPESLAWVAGWINRP